MGSFKTKELIISALILLLLGSSYWIFSHFYFGNYLSVDIVNRNDPDIAYFLLPPGLVEGLNNSFTYEGRATGYYTTWIGMSQHLLFQLIFGSWGAVVADIFITGLTFLTSYIFFRKLTGNHRVSTIFAWLFFLSISFFYTFFNEELFGGISLRTPRPFATYPIIFVCLWFAMDLWQGKSLASKKVQALYGLAMASVISYDPWSTPLLYILTFLFALRWLFLLNKKHEFFCLVNIGIFLLLSLLPFLITNHFKVELFDERVGVFDVNHRVELALTFFYHSYYYLQFILLGLMGFFYLVLKKKIAFARISDQGIMSVMPILVMWFLAFSSPAAFVLLIAKSLQYYHFQFVTALFSLIAVLSLVAIFIARSTKVAVFLAKYNYPLVLAMLCLSMVCHGIYSTKILEESGRKNIGVPEFRDDLDRFIDFTRKATDIDPDTVLLSRKFTDIFHTLWLLEGGNNLFLPYYPLTSISKEEHLYRVIDKFYVMHRMDLSSKEARSGLYKYYAGQLSAAATVSKYWNYSTEEGAYTEEDLKAIESISSGAPWKWGHRVLSASQKREMDLALEKTLAGARPSFRKDVLLGSSLTPLPLFVHYEDFVFGDLWLNATQPVSQLVNSKPSYGVVLQDDRPSWLALSEKVENITLEQSITAFKGSEVTRQNGGVNVRGGSGGARLLINNNNAFNKEKHYSVLVRFASDIAGSLELLPIRYPNKGFDKDDMISIPYLRGENTVVVVLGQGVDNNKLLLRLNRQAGEYFVSEIEVFERDGPPSLPWQLADRMTDESSGL